MFWLFAAVVLVLTVYHEGFRKVVFWCAGLSAVVVAFILAATAVEKYRDALLALCVLATLITAVVCVWRSWDGWTVPPSTLFKSAERRAEEQRKELGYD